MKCAYVTLVMKGDFYTPGALALAQSLRNTGTKHALVCMVTEDVEGVGALSEVFDRVVTVEYLTYDTWKLAKKKSEIRYGTWMSVALTQYQCLGLVEYSKVCFLDADVLVRRNMDCVFDVRTPAGTFVDGGKIFGDLVYPEEIRKMVADKAYVCPASSLVFSPGIAVYNKFVDYVNKLYHEQGGVLGVKGMKSGVNEQIIAFFYSFRLRLNWTNLGSAFQHCWWAKPDPTIRRPFLHHYVEARKPWEDLERPEWWAVAKQVINARNKRFFNVKTNLRIAGH